MKYRCARALRSCRYTSALHQKFAKGMSSEEASDAASDVSGDAALVLLDALRVHDEGGPANDAWVRVETLDASNNALTALPASLVMLTALKLLNVNDNKLSELPEWIGDLRAMEEFFANDNELTALPASLAKLTALKKLEARDNKLSELPEWIGELRALESLDAGNALTALPASLS